MNRTTTRSSGRPDYSGSSTTLDDDDDVKSCSLSFIQYDNSYDEEANAFMASYVRVSSPVAILEEKIEEEITTAFPEEMSMTSDSDAKFRVGHETCDYPVELNMNERAYRVPFPELGVDVIDMNFSTLSNEGDRTDSGIRLTDLQSWEENWLFQKKRKATNSVCNQYCLSELDLAAGPVKMLIPKPSQFVETRIGSIEIDQLSEFSERNSAGSSLSFSSDAATDSLDELDSDNKATIDEVITISVSETDDEAFVDAEVSPSPAEGQQVKRQQHEQRDEDEPQSQQLHPHQPSAATATARSSEQQQENICNNKPAQDEKVIVVQRSLSPTFHRRPVAVGQSLKSTVQPLPLVVPKFVPLNQRMESARTDPAFVIKPCGASVQTDIIVQFCCRVKGSKPMKVTWFKSDLQLANDETFRIFNAGNEYVLEIKCTRMELSDTYSCVVYNHHGEEWSDFSLRVRQVWEKQFSTPLAKHPVKELKGEAKVERGIKVPVGDGLKGSPPVVIQRTWAERAAELQDANEDNNQAKSEGESVTSQLGQLNQRQVDGEQKATPMTFPLADQEKSKRENCTLSWPENPYTEENVRRRERRHVVYSSEDSSGFGSLSQRGMTPTTEAVEGEEGEEEEDESPISTLTNTASKDLSRHKRDYIVPLDCQVKSVIPKSSEKQVFQIRSMKEPDSLSKSSHCHARSNFQADRRSSGSSSQISTDGADHTGGRDHQHLGEEEEDGSEEKDHYDTHGSLERLGAASPSVRSLIQKFSEGSNLRRSSTFSSTRSIHDDCHGKGILPKMKPVCGNKSFEVPYTLTTWDYRHSYPSTTSVASDDECFLTNHSSRACSPFMNQTSTKYTTISDGYLSQSSPSSPSLMVHGGEHSSNVHSLTARSMKREFRQQKCIDLPRALNRLGSVSLFQIDQFPVDDGQRSSSPGTATTCSPTNAGYASDESTNSSTGVHADHRAVVQVKGPRKNGSRPSRPFSKRVDASL
ncbi:hypothetical protein HDE_07474 [Halotydeus destructor]|nr:hypothetical protein HDE_07474 [Halotydeus destructor]